MCAFACFFLQCFIRFQSNLLVYFASWNFAGAKHPTGTWQPVATPVIQTLKLFLGLSFGPKILSAFLRMWVCHPGPLNIAQRWGTSLVLSLLITSNLWVYEITFVLILWRKLNKSFQTHITQSLSCLENSRTEGNRVGYWIHLRWIRDGPKIIVTGTFLTELFSSFALFFCFKVSRTRFFNSFLMICFSLTVRQQPSSGILFRKLLTMWVILTSI